jgi:hypothetical protein
MRKKILIKCVLLVFAGVLRLQAQTLSPTVVSSSGGYFTSANASLSFTVAEMTMVQTFTTAGNILTQGFQQPEDMSVSIQETPTVSGEIMIYPNPTNGNFTLSYVSNENSETTINLYNLVGQVVLSKSVSQVKGLNTVNFDISSFSPGIYMLELSLTNARGEKKATYQKINLVY